ncbi:MAG TPA: lysyl oxidase family protein [Candidatus Limnocylindria bacterium]
MTHIRRRAPILILSLVVAMTALLTPPLRQAEAAPAEALRPNLQMLRLHDWHLQTVNGRRLLRFTTIFVNQGPGPFELRGGRSSGSDKTMEMDQVLYRTDGSRFRRPTEAVARYAGDGHDHWHVQGVVVYEAWKLTDPQNANTGAKTGFCFFDTTPWKLSLPNARRTGYYEQEWCGVKASMTNRVGLSVGWGDRYPWDFVFQWIDITGLPAGAYRVRATVDIHDYYRETDELDNCVWSEIRIPAQGSGNTVKVLRNGRGCGPSAMTAVSSFAAGETFDPPRDVTLSAGAHSGWTYNSAGTQLRRLRRDLAGERAATATARATPPGQTGNWLYMATGPFAGYWVKQGGGVQLQP